ncbi:MAG: methyltransferase [Archaeoglobus sp.]|nr:MAG: methyltransferase [Archaeoglobus sp.]
MKFKRKLSIELERLEGFKNPKIMLEQYVTPPSLVAEIVSKVSLIDGLNRRVVDLGCGTGIISIAFELLGTESIGFEIDREALEVARRNSRNAGVKPDFILCDVRKIELRRGDYMVVMNPPFGIHKKFADRIFLEKAMNFGEVIYSIHSAGSEKFIRSMSSERGFSVTHVWRYLIPLKRTYSFHEKDFKQIAVEVYRIVRRS